MRAKQFIYLSLKFWVPFVLYWLRWCFFKQDSYIFKLSFFISYTMILLVFEYLRLLGFPQAALSYIFIVFKLLKSWLVLETSHWKTISMTNRVRLSLTIVFNHLTLRVWSFWKKLGPVSLQTAHAQPSNCSSNGAERKQPRWWRLLGVKTHCPSDPIAQLRARRRRVRTYEFGEFRFLRV